MVALSLGEVYLLGFDYDHLFALYIFSQLVQKLPLSFLIFSHNFKYLLALVPHDEVLISPNNQKRALKINLRIFLERVRRRIDAEMRAGYTYVFPGVTVGSSGYEFLLLVVVEHDKQ